MLTVHSFNRPDNLLTNFISWRGMLTKMLCSLYNHQEPWKVAATLYQGTIYLQEIETEEKRRQEAEMPEKQREMSYWGLKFENYVTCKGIGERTTEGYMGIPACTCRPRIERNAGIL